MTDDDDFFIFIKTAQDLDLAVAGDAGLYDAAHDGAVVDDVDRCLVIFFDDRDARNQQRVCVLLIGDCEAGKHSRDEVARVVSNYGRRFEGTVASIDRRADACDRRIEHHTRHGIDFEVGAVALCKLCELSLRNLQVGDELARFGDPESHVVSSNVLAELDLA